MLFLLGLKVIFGYLEVRYDTIMILGGLNISISIGKKKNSSLSISINKKEFQVSVSLIILPKSQKECRVKSKHFSS